MTQEWIIRAGRNDGYEEAALEHGMISVGWSATGDLTSSRTLADIGGLVRVAYPNVEAKSAESYALQLFDFRHRMAEGDLVLLLRRTSPDVAIGRISGPYQFRDDLGEGVRHVRSVRWSRTDIPRATVARELLTLPALIMVLRVDQVDTVDRLRHLAGDAGTTVFVAPDDAGVDVPELSKPFVDLQRNLNYARSLATAGQHLAQLQVGSFEIEDVFRAAWVQSVAALDHWVRQEIHARMLWLAARPSEEKPAGFSDFPMTLGLMEEVRQGRSLVDAIDQQLRETRSHLTYQHPNKIKEAFALVSDVKGLWDKVAKVLSEQAGDGESVSGGDVHQRLRAIVHRRNKIAHEYDEDPANPPAKRSIDAASATQTIDWIEQVAAAILQVLDRK